MWAWPLEQIGVAIFSFGGYQIRKERINPKCDTFRGLASFRPMTFGKMTFGQNSKTILRYIWLA